MINFYSMARRYLFPVRIDSLVIPTLICFIIVFIGIWRLSYIDLKYREVKSFTWIILLYIPSIFAGWAIYGFSRDLIVGFFALALFLWFVQFIFNFKVNYNLEPEKQVIYVGLADILSAPLYTVWFGCGVITFFVIFLLVLVGAERIPKMKEVMNSLCVNKNIALHDYMALLPCMQLTFIITLFWYVI